MTSLVQRDRSSILREVHEFRYIKYRIYRRAPIHVTPHLQLRPRQRGMSLYTSFSIV